MKKAIHFYFQNLNTFRLFTSGALFCFAIYCLVWNRDLPFTLPNWVYALAFFYFAVFPVKDMVGRLTETLYKGKQFQKNYQPMEDLNETEFQAMKKRYDRGAARSMAFWLCFLGIIGLLKYYKVIGREWIFFFFAMSNFCVFFAVFFWCPFHKVLLKPKCCMDCRIYNWDSFFAYSFLIFTPSVFSFALVLLAVVSLVEWEITYHKHPKRFFTASNDALKCENCDLEYCKNHKKQRFHKELKDAEKECRDIEIASKKTDKES